ncbi:hypothetical protein HDU83_001809 [Entophlyctis luteolus]|nr:hypothetical protein HDU83_001809 [Entophlyctis luteolus]
MSAFDPGAVSSTTPVVVDSQSAQPAVHYLACGVCRWESLEVGLKFDRPTGLAMQMQKFEEDRADILEFAGLRAHYEKVIAHATSISLAASAAAAGAGTDASTSVADLLRLSSSVSLPASLLANIPALAAFGAAKIGGSAGVKNPAEEEEYESKVKKDDSRANIVDDADAMVSLQLETASSLKQRFRQLDTQPRFQNKLMPQRILLRTKRTKRCKECDHVLAKPEKPEPKQLPANPNTATLAFTVVNTAIDYMPNITLVEPIPKISNSVAAGSIVTVKLKFLNPQVDAMQIMLATISPQMPASPESSGTDKGGAPQILENDIMVNAPLFVLGAYNELQEFEDDRSKKPMGMDDIEFGVLEKRNNWAVVSVDVTVNRSSGGIEARITLVLFRLTNHTAADPTVSQVFPGRRRRQRAESGFGARVVLGGSERLNVINLNPFWFESADRHCRFQKSQQGHRLVMTFCDDNSQLARILQEPDGCWGGVSQVYAVFIAVLRQNYSLSLTKET